MSETGNLITPIFNREPFFDKPPLYFWLTALSFKLFGVSEFSERFFSALAGVGVGLTLYFLARLLFNNSVALLSLIVLSSAIGFLYRSRTGNLDTLLTFFVLLSAFAFYKGQDKKSDLWYLIFGVAVGLGFLTKGAISFLFPLLAAAYCLHKKDFSLLKKTSFAILIGIVISAVWIGLSFIANGYPFVSDFYNNQTTKISTTPFFWKNFSFDYFGHLKSGLKLWSLLFTPAFIYSLYAWWKKTSFLITLYFIVFFGILLFSQITSNWFIMPLYPLIALIIGFGLYRLVNRFLGKKFIPYLVATVFAITIYHLVLYNNEYAVKDVSMDETNVALFARRFTRENDTLYLTNYYFPTTIFYSNRKVYAVYSEQEENQAWWVKPRTAWKEILKSDRVFVVTTKEEFKNLSDYFSPYKFEVLHQSGQKLLLKKV
jgi:4-amino-4-deoxy-L-arabinose transferase-like glycosyltransferase